MKKSKGIVSLVLIAALLGLLGFTCWQGFGSSHTGSARNINLGLDLAGGVSITYQTKDKNPSAEDMKDTIYKLQKRVEQYSTEASVYQEGDDRINIEIPGVSDANKVLEELGKPGSLVFQDADGNTVLEGTDVKNAEAQTQENSTTKNKEYVVALQLTKEGTTKFAEATAANVFMMDRQSVHQELIRRSKAEKPLSQGCQAMKKQTILRLPSESVDFLWNWKNFALM